METKNNKWKDNEFLRDYRNNYYRTKLSDIYKNKIECPGCNRLVAVCSYRRHLNTELHKVNSLNDDERNEYLKNKKINQLLNNNTV